MTDVHGSAGSSPAIDIRNVEFGWTARSALLSIQQLTIARGERVFLKGASGSGKSTLLGLIGGVLKPRAGTVRVIDTSLNTLSASQRDRFRGEHIGFIFQMFNLIPYLSVLENVLLPLRFSSARRRRINTIDVEGEASRLRALGLTDAQLLNRSVTQLSMGQQQRVAAARALIGCPAIVIADEPTSALDADTRAGFLQLLMSECALSAITLLFVSHDAALGTLFDRTLSMGDINGVKA
jgi:putative ABC transport system ATP-binding protein